MKYKLSLSLLTCLAISGGGYLFAEELNCGGITPCDLTNKTITVTGTQNITQDIQGNGANISVTGNLTANNITLTGGSFKNDKSGQINITNLNGSGTAFTGSVGNGALFKVDNFTLKDKSNFYIWHNNTGNTFVKIGTLTLDNSSFSKNSSVEINKAIMTNGADYANHFYGTTINELEIDSTSKFNNAQGGSTIKKVTNVSQNGAKVTINAGGGSLTIGDSANPTQNSMTNIDIKGGGSFEVINMKLDSTNKIDVSGNIVLNGKIDINSMDLSKATSTPTSHKIVIKDNSNVVITDTNLTNQSINANSSNDKNGSLTIKGGIFNNVNIGGAGTNLANLTLDTINIDNSGLNKNNNITAQNITINNITTSNNANINAKTKLNISGSTLNNTNNINAANAEIGTSTIGANINISKELKATNGANLNSNITAGTIVAENGSVFNGTTKANDSITANAGSSFKGSTTATNKITSTGAAFGGTVSAKDLFSQKDTTSGTNSTFNGIVNITNSITASDTTFAKDVTANTITANSGSNFNANTTATNKITSNGATFGGLVKANELETLAANKSTFKGNVDITNKITSANATFEAQIKTAFLEANANSNFTATSNVIATDIKATGSTFSGNIAKNNSITADSSTFEKAIDTNKLTASNGSKFNGTVTANDLETLAGAVASSFTNTVNVTNTLTSANANFTNNVTAGAITANNGSSFGGITTANTIIANNGSVFDTNSNVKANDSIIANAGSNFKGSTTATNKITSNGASFDGTINSAFLEANSGSTFAATSNINATDIKATGSKFEGQVAKNNSITADSSSFANAIDTNTLTATNNSSFKNVNANTIEATNSIFGGIVTASDTITANTGANFTSEVSSNILIANNGSVFDTTSKVNVKDSIIANAGSSFKGSVATDFLAADKGAEFIGTTDVRQLYANGSVFGGKVSVNCEDPAVCGSVISGSTFSDLELKNNTQAIIDSGSKVANLTLSDNTMAKLDNNSNIGNLTLTNQANKVLIEGGSNITGDIKNEGEIYVNNGTISSAITGSGDLFTSEVTYKESVSLSDIKGSGSTYEKDATATNSAIVDNSTFGGTFTVGGKLTANQGNKFNIVNANSADFLYDANKGASKDITANDINVTTGLVIDNINVTSNKISANTATIKNSANVSSLLTGASDVATKVYDANITKGNTYNVDNSTIKGGIRADKLNTSKSNIHAQVATNTLNASNTTFYIYGNGTNTSFYDGYSGAIIAREGAIGGGNNIQLANTNLSLLTQGFVPVAIIKQSTPTGGVVTAAATSSIGEDFFKVTYKSKLAMYELVDKYKHFSDINGSYVWSVGVSGEDLVNNTNIDNVISGADSTNIANGANNNYNLTSLEVEVGDMFKPTEFDKEAIDTAKFILTSPDYIIRTKNNTLSKRFRALKDYKLGNGFWLDNQMGYAKYEYNAIRYKNMSVGVDKTNEFNNSDLTLGLAASVGRAETKGNLSSDADSKGFGIYALNKFNNNVFIGANAFYHNIASSYEAKMLDVKANKSHNVYEASIESGVRFGDKVYFEPSLKYHLTSYKPTAINQEGLVLKGDSQLKHELGVALEGGFKVPNVFDAYLAVGLSKELNHKPDLIFIDELKIQNKVDGSKGDTSVGINFGVDYKLSPNASFNIDLGSNLYTNSDKELKGNIGFSYRF